MRNQWTCENQIRRDVSMARATKGEGHQMMRDSPLVTDMPRDKYVERCKQRALDYLDRGDIEKAVTSIITTMDARTDCKIPDYLATLGGSLLMANDALGLRLLIEDLR